MNKERTKVGTIEISKMTGKPIICTKVEYNAKGDVHSTWLLYENNLLKTKMGMSPETHYTYPLQHFVDVLEAHKNTKEVEKKRDTLEETIETLMNTFSTEMHVHFGDIEVWADRDGKVSVSIDLKGEC